MVSKGYVMEQVGAWSEARTCILGCSLEAARPQGHGRDADQTARVMQLGLHHGVSLVPGRDSLHQVIQTVQGPVN